MLLISIDLMFSLSRSFARGRVEELQLLDDEVAEAEGLLGHVLALIMLQDVQRVVLVVELDDHGAVSVLLMLLEELVDFALGAGTVDGLPDDVLEVGGAFDPGQVSLVLELVELLKVARLEGLLEGGESDEPLVIDRVPCGILEAVGAEDLVVFDDDEGAVFVAGEDLVVLVRTGSVEFHVAESEAAIVLREGEERVLLALGLLDVLGLLFLLLSVFLGCELVGLVGLPGFGPSVGQVCFRWSLLIFF